MRYFDLTVPSPRDEDVDIEITVKAERVDNGIGAYEYWGAKGVDHQWELEWKLDESPIPDDEIYDNRKLCERIQEEIEERWRNTDE
jgi:hypothetical protein